MTSIITAITPNMSVSRPRLSFIASSMAESGCDTDSTPGIADSSLLMTEIRPCEA